MLWIDVIDIIYLVVGACIGFIIAGLMTASDDACDNCEYREFIEGWLNDERE